MDQLTYASLSHTHFWYEVGMLKVPVIRMFDRLDWSIDHAFEDALFRLSRLVDSRYEILVYVIE